MRCTPESPSAVSVVRRAAPLQFFLSSQNWKRCAPMATVVVLAIAHAEKDGTAVLDATVTRKSPFSPEQVVGDFATALKRYRCAAVTGDHFGGDWPREQFRKHGITYNVSSKTKRDLYLDVLPLINSGKADLLDNPQIGAEFCALERRRSRGGRDTIDHPLNAHDDLANAIAGALCLAVDAAARNFVAFVPPVFIDPSDYPEGSSQFPWEDMNPPFVHPA